MLDNKRAFITMYHGLNKEIQGRDRTYTAYKIFIYPSRVPPFATQALARWQQSGSHAVVNIFSSTVLPHNSRTKHLNSTTNSIS
ncbi:hypothetical protein ONS95_000302 [Cadophora gregata]|uniref:uncharacterized protein n=1 Tax=Cadophora gregata TaxID=51156 RepID=UPI0026DACEE9|nr:uncharacterized protein ONS95_000302 [Cadophora gregata]KAK0128327.1 hypothetical protein ONS95_000302 [Cadophora gregata]